MLVIKLILQHIVIYEYTVIYELYYSPPHCQSKSYEIWGFPPAPLKPFKQLIIKVLSAVYF